MDTSLILCIFISLLVLVQGKLHSGSDFPDGTVVQTWNCTGKSNQDWNIATDGTFEIRLQVDGKCLDINDWDSSNGAKVQLWTCHPDSQPQNQQWTYNAQNGQIISKMNGKCLTVMGPADQINPIQMWTCTGAPSKTWKYNPHDDTLRSGLSEYIECLDAGSVLSCQQLPLNQLPFCDWTLPVGKRVADLVSRMELSEKPGQMVNEAMPIPRLGVPAYDWWNECLHGVASGCGTRCPTSFPAPSGLGASFNMTLIHAMAQAISTEARALNNEQVYGLTYWAPNININRDPRWGRNQEVPGEDPFLTAQYVANFAKGLQDGEDSRYIKVVSTCKHYAAYSLENWEGMDRYHFNAIVSDRDLVETYLPAFESCIKVGQAQSVMCSYNEVNGIPSCANQFLLQEILRNSWDWDGYVVSDCGAISCIQNTHKYTNNTADTCGVAIGAGTDLNCGTYYSSYLLDAVAKGKVTEEQLDVSLQRLFTKRFQLGMFDPPDVQVYTRFTPDLVDTKEHSNLAYFAAQQSIVLLQNNNQVLPLSKKMKVAVIGPNANVTETLLSNYHGSRCLDNTYDCVQTPYNAIKAKGVIATYNKGCDINSTDTSGFAVAVTAAKAADVAVLFLGIDQSIESEGMDRISITLPGVQQQLAEQIYAAAKVTIVVLINGGQLAIEWIQDNVPGIIEAFYPGENGAMAIADVLFGDYNPGGKLPYTIYPADYVDQISMLNMNMSGNPGRSYRYYTGQVKMNDCSDNNSQQALWNFGFGLSYTTFNITWVDSQPPIQRVNSKSLQDIGFTAKVKNTGKIAGDEVVMAFVNGDGVDTPLKQLFGFQRVHLDAGEETEVFFSSSPSILSKVTATGHRILHPGLYKVTLENGSTQIMTNVKVI